VSESQHWRGREQGPGDGGVGVWLLLSCRGHCSRERQGARTSVEAAAFTKTAHCQRSLALFSASASKGQQKAKNFPFPLLPSPTHRFWPVEWGPLKKETDGRARTHL